MKLKQRVHEYLAGTLHTRLDEGTTRRSRLSMSLGRGNGSNLAQDLKVILCHNHSNSGQKIIDLKLRGNCQTFKIRISPICNTLLLDPRPMFNE